ncbi:MAG TPA: DUF5985 family protein [Herpetosiphonaceae bacterium]
MAILVYSLCALTSLACMLLLARAYHRTRVRLLFWSSLCFAGLTLNSLLLIVDTRILPAVNLATIRALPALVGLTALLYGLVWDRSSTPQ